MNRAENDATPLGLEIGLKPITSGSRCCGNPRLFGVTPLAYLLFAIPSQRHYFAASIRPIESVGISQPTRIICNRSLIDIKRKLIAFDNCT